MIWINLGQLQSRTPNDPFTVELIHEHFMILYTVEQMQKDS